MLNFKSLTVSLFVVCSSFFTLFAEEAGVKWETDLEAAKKSAATNKKNIFALFTGSDWCTYCIMLEKEVFSKDDFLKKISGDYVLLMVDFPQRKPLPEEQQAKNNKLSENYGIEGFPTVLLLDYEGKAYAKTGYEEGGPEKYIENLKKLQLKKDERDKAITEAKAKQGVAKATALIGVLKSLGELPKLQYKDLESEIFAADPEDKSGYKKMVELQEKINGLDQLIIDFLQNGKVDEAKNKIDKFLETEKLEGEDKQKVLILKVFTYEPNPGNYAEIEKLLKSIIEIDPKSGSAEMAREFERQLAELKKAPQTQSE